MKKWAIAVGLALLAIAPMAFLAYHYGFSDQQNSSNDNMAVIEFVANKNTILEPGSEIEVKACKVIDGYKYELHLEGNQWIEAHLAVATKYEATKVVAEWLRKAGPPAPTVVLKRHIDGYWIVDLHATVDNARVNVVDMLKAKELLLY
jgi:hypothetical protein